MKEVQRIKFIDNGNVTQAAYDAYNVIRQNTSNEKFALITGITNISHAIAGVHIFLEAAPNSGRRLKTHKYIPSSQYDDMFGPNFDFDDISAFNSKIRNYLVSAVVAWRYVKEKDDDIPQLLKRIELIFDGKPERLSNILYRWQPGDPVLDRSKTPAT